MNKQAKFDSNFLVIAHTMADFSTCLRGNVGAVIALDNRIIATGYNGAPSKTTECVEAGCFKVDGHCVRTTHAEINAILQCAKNGVSTLGATIYCTHKPCLDCTKAIINAGISRIVYENFYSSGLLKDALADEQLTQARIKVEQLHA